MSYVYDNLTYPPDTQRPGERVNATEVNTLFKRLQNSLERVGKEQVGVGEIDARHIDHAPAGGHWKYIETIDDDTRYAAATPAWVKSIAADQVLLDLTPVPAEEGSLVFVEAYIPVSAYSAQAPVVSPYHPDRDINLELEIRVTDPAGAAGVSPLGRWVHLQNRATGTAPATHTPPAGTVSNAFGMFPVSIGHMFLAPHTGEYRISLFAIHAESNNWVIGGDGAAGPSTYSALYATAYRMTVMVVNA